MPNFKANFIDNSNKILIDEVDTTTTYVWNAEIGSEEASSVWAIRKLTTVWWAFSVEFAEWSPNFDKVWNDRATYSYS